MKDNACFRVSIDDVAADLPKYLELAKTRTFEIYDRGEVEVMLVRIDAVRDWHEKLQINIPAELMANDDLAALQAESDWLQKWIEENGDVWPDEIG